MGVDFSEFEDFIQTFEKGAAELENTTDVPFDELFNHKFMENHTNFSSIDEFLEQSGFDCSSTDAFEAIPDDLMDKYVREHTSFHSWQEMLEEATGDYVAKKLGF